MLNENAILSMVRNYTNTKNEISEEKFLDLVSGLDEAEVQEVIEILHRYNIEVAEEAAASTVFYGDSGKLMKLTNEQLCVMGQTGDMVAYNALVLKNERLVEKIAWKVLHDYSPELLELEDLCSVGDQGLIKAAEKFDVTLDYKFSTYACWWIRQSITRYVMDHGYGMRIPVHVFERVIQVSKIRKALNGGTVNDIREKLWQDYGRSYSMEEVEKLILYGERYLNTTSLNTTVGEEGDTELLDFVASDISVEEEVFSRMNREALEDVLATLTDKENAVLHMRFGLGGGKQMTLEEVGRQYGVTRERIRQIEAKAVKKLQHPSRARRLREIYYVY